VPDLPENPEMNIYKAKYTIERVLDELVKDYMPKLEKKFDDDEVLSKTKFTGVNVCGIDEQDTDIFERNHYINLFPNGIWGSGNSSMPDLMLDKIINLPLFLDIKKMAAQEALRLLYVGVTRAKDILVSLTYKSKGNDNSIEFLWPYSLGIGDGISAAPFGVGRGEKIIELIDCTEAYNSPITPQYRQVINKPGICEQPPLFLSPSTIDYFEDSFTKNIEAADAGNRIIDMNMFSREASDATKGTCIHDIFASYEPGDDEKAMERIGGILSGFGFHDILQEHKRQLIRSINWLYDYLTSTYGPALRTERECPLLYTLPTGQILRGEIDLLWYYKDIDGQERCILVDYKSFPGERSKLEEHTAKYYAQLSAYNAALTAAQVDVADTLVYYPVQAHIRKLIK